MNNTNVEKMLMKDTLYIYGEILENAKVSKRIISNLIATNKRLRKVSYALGCYIFIMTVRNSIRDYRITKLEKGTEQVEGE